MKVKVTNIKWDTDGDEEMRLELPRSKEIDVEDEDEIADTLSDMYGYCVESFDFKVISS